MDAGRVCGLPAPLHNVFVNSSDSGVWTQADAAIGGGRFRVVNNTATCVPPRLIIFEGAPPQLQWEPLPPQWVQNGEVAFCISGGTLVPLDLRKAAVRPHPEAAAGAPGMMCTPAFPVHMQSMPGAMPMVMPPGMVPNGPVMVNGPMTWTQPPQTFVRSWQFSGPAIGGCGLQGPFTGSSSAAPPPQGTPTDPALAPSALPDPSSTQAMDCMSSTAPAASAAG